jgi:toxin-antitoxin system PIN domain toxin
VIAVDANLLVYASDRNAPEHARAGAAMRWLVGQPAWGLPWIVVGEFYAVVTDPRRWRQPRSEAAIEAIDAWLATPGVQLIGEPPGHWPTLRALLSSARPLGRAVHDARLVAVCVAAGVAELWSADRDFGRYPELRVRNPLVDFGP